MLETIYMLQVSKAILSERLVWYLEDISSYKDNSHNIFISSKEFIVSVDLLTYLTEDKCDIEIIEEIQKIIKEIEAEIDPEFDGLEGYDYIQFI